MYTYDMPVAELVWTNKDSVHLDIYYQSQNSYSRSEHPIFFKMKTNDYHSHNHGIVIIALLKMLPATSFQIQSVGRNV